MSMKREFVFLLIALAFAAVFVALADEAGEQELFQVDHAVHTFAHSVRQPGLDGIMQGLSTLGSGYILVPLNIVLLVLLWPRSRQAALLIPGLTLGAVVIEGLAKWLVHRPRPRGVGYGFPSGHAIASMVFFSVLIYLVWTMKARSAYCWAVTLIGACAIIGIGVSRLYLNAHWLTDVLGGWAGGMSYLWFALAWLERRRSRATSDGIEP